MRVQSGNANAIQMLQAQQAFAARRAAHPQSAPDLPVADPVQQKEEMPVSLMALQRLPQWRQTVSEVTHIAQKAGYVGLSEQDIQRAYVNGESLLADYRV